MASVGGILSVIRRLSKARTPVYIIHVVRKILVDTLKESKYGRGGTQICRCDESILLAD